jgi:hypothetical protein
MRTFLAMDIPWFLRAIDDSWFNPGNLHIYINQMSSFLDPFRHVVIKAHMGPNFLVRWGITFLQGGAPILMSRAAVRHVLPHFSNVCGSRHWPADDITLCLIVNRSFPLFWQWADVHFAGAISAHRDSAFALAWWAHVTTHFVAFNQSCRLPPLLARPLKTLVGVHSWGGLEPWRHLVESCSDSWFPENLLFEYCTREGYRICRDSREARRLMSVQYLESVTPKLSIGDPSLNFSLADLWQWGFEHIPRLPWLPARPQHIEAFAR